MNSKNRVVCVDGINISNNHPIAVFAGPCQIESMDHTLFMVEALVKITDKLGIPFIYKSSFDKANRSSASSERGIGINKSMEIFSSVKQNFGCPIVTDVHTEEQCNIIANYVDVLQIPAFLCRQTDLLKAAAETGKVVKVKKGQFLAPWDVDNIVEKFNSFGHRDLLITERGTSFGYNTLVSDMRGLEIMKETGVPVIFDATHSVQQPGGKGKTSGGERRFVETLARAAVAVGVAGVYLEVHQDPDNAPSDGPNMVILSRFESLLSRLMRFDDLSKSHGVMAGS
jgi:2-dehydro-3-deoxyphosphooctonate aldolase (KDO 8-P synthase)